VKVFNLLRGACIAFYEKLSPLSVPESRSPTHVPVSRNIHFRLVLEKLKRPNFASLFCDVMPTYLANWLFEHNVPDMGDLKRDSGDTEDSCIAKHHCMDGDSLRPCAVDVSADLQFTQLLYETADCGMVPLPLFLNDALSYISINGANLLTFKANLKPGEKKGFTIIDCKKLLARLNLAELTMTHAEWSEAAYNCFRFHSGHDIHGPKGSYASWWDKHFCFSISKKTRSSIMALGNT
jgi:hypothetical protein